MNALKKLLARPAAARVARIACVSALAAAATLGAPELATASVFSASAQFQVSLTIVCVAQDEFVQCGGQKYLARKETAPVHGANATEPSSDVSAAPAASDGQARLLTTITY